MMKTNYLFIGMAVLMMAACSNDENETQVNDGRVAVSFAGGITLTRATTDAWEANDGIGIYMLEHGTKTVAHGAANRKYVTTAGNGEFTPAGVEQTIYFPLNADEKVDFIAYYPQIDLTDDIYKVDVSDQKNPADIDLLRSDNATGKDKSTNTVDLNFFHRLSRVEVELTAGEGVSDAELAGMGITLSKQPVKADFNVLQNTLTAGQDEGDRFEGFDVEVAAVDGDLRAGGLPQIARGLGPAVEVDDRGGEPASGVGGDGDALPRPEHVDLGVAAFGAAAEVGRAPLGGGECNRVAGCLRRGAGGKEEQQGSRQNFVHGSDKRVSSHKFTHLARI